MVINDYVQYRVCAKTDSHDVIAEETFIYTTNNEYETKTMFAFDNDAAIGATDTDNYETPDLGWHTAKYSGGNIDGVAGSGACSQPNYFVYHPVDISGSGLAYAAEVTSDAAVFVPNEEGAALTFWVYQSPDYDNTNTVRVYIIKRGMAGEKISAELPCYDATAGWNQYSIDLSAYKDHYVQWGITARGEKKIYVDDVQISQMKLAPAVCTPTTKDMYRDTTATLSNAAGNTVLYKTFAEGSQQIWDDAGLQTYSEPLKPDGAGYAVYACAMSGSVTSAISSSYIAAYECKPVTPSPAEGIVDLNTEITLACADADASIYYTTDGSSPVGVGDAILPTAIKYTAPVKITQPMTITAVAAAAGVHNSKLTTLKYDFQQANMVTASVQGGSKVAQGTKVTLACDTADTVIKYTTDGTMPTDTNGIMYTAPVEINSDTTITAVALHPTFKNSKAAILHYYIDIAGDAFEPNNTTQYASAIGFPFRVNATIHDASDKDYYSFEFPTNTRLEAVLVSPNPKELPYSVSFIDDSGKVIASSESGVSQVIAAGRYLALVEGGGKYSPKEYTLSVSRLAPMGLDFSEKNMLTTMLSSQSPRSWDGGMNGGGHVIESTAYFAGWQGPVAEADDPYDGSKEMLKKDPVTGADIVDESKVVYKPMAPNYHLQTALWLPRRTSVTDNDHIKSAIYTYGAIEAHFDVSFDFFSGDRQQYYYRPENASTASGGGHIISVVGWDDTIPASAFTNIVNGKECTPAGDGAYIVKNSWGTAVEDQGFFYMSYYSDKLFENQPGVFVLEEMPDNYNTVYEYDPLGNVAPISHNTNVIFSKNVFTANSNQKLRAVSFYSINENSVYDIYVKVGNAPQEQVASGYNYYDGYKTVRLGKEIDLPAGTKFEVVLRTQAADNGVADAAMEVNVDGLTSKASSSPGQSFTSSDGVKWDDVSKEYNANACIKAFTYDASKGRGISRAAMARDTNHNGFSVEEWNAKENAVPISFEKSGGGVVYNVENESAQAIAAPMSALPSKFDLREIGAVSAVKNQGEIGACWTFGAMSSAESVFMRRNNTAFTYPMNISLDKTEETLTLSDAVRTVDFAATAAVTPQNVTSDSVTWSFTGDVDSIDIKTHTSRSGESAVLFTAKATGTIVVTAQSTADALKTASMTVKIVDNSQIEGALGKEIVSVPTDANGNYDAALMDGILANLQPNQAMLLRTVNGAIIPKHIFEMIAGQDKTVVFEVVSADGRIVRFAFNGKSITNPMDLNLTISTTPSAAASAAYTLGAGEKYMFLNFGHSGRLPGEATVSIAAVPPFAVGDKPGLKYFNPSRNAYEGVANTLAAVDANGFWYGKFSSCSEYIITDKT
ncbi:MAG: lectin like domain-containing protein, partial [Christensenella sp.]